MAEKKSPLGNKKTFSKEEAVKLFNALANDPELRNEVVNEGCYQRTQKVCEQIQGMGKEALFTVTDGDYNNAYSAEFTAKANNKAVKFTHNWSSHTAAVIMVDNDKVPDKKEPIVLDPMMMDGPESLDGWNKNIIENHSQKPATTYFCEYNGFDKDFIDRKCRGAPPLRDVINAYPDYTVNKMKSEWLNDYQQEALSKVKALRMEPVRQPVAPLKSNTTDLSKVDVNTLKLDNSHHSR